MESLRGKNPIPATSSRRGAEVGPGLRKVRPPIATQTFDTIDLKSAKSDKTFHNSVTVTIPTGYNVKDFPVPHKIGTIPSDMIIGTKNANVNVWRGTKDWNRSEIYVRADNAVTATIYLVP